MTFADLNNSINPEDVGREMYSMIEELYPICRSITGNGVRQTLHGLQKLVPLTIHEVPTGTQVFDWTVPKEWNIRDAYVADLNSRRVIDFRKSNLHILNYSIPTQKRVSLEELRQHLFSLPEHPDWIPYRTSYYKEDWGFCLTHNDLSALTESEYDVCIDTTLQDGHLSFGEYYLKGLSSEEVLISCHVCHPSLANDNLSGLVLATFLARHLGNLSLRYSYRFLFIPGTIGAITWLSLNEKKTPGIKHGLVVACTGDPGKFTYKKSRWGNKEIDRAVTHVLHHSGNEYDVVDFSPYGYDERQYCSPGFNLPVGSLTRTPHGRFPEYHTSADNLDLVQPQYLANSFMTYLSVLQLLENNKRYLNLNPKCEPQLGHRGLYAAIGGSTHARTSELAILWTLNLADNDHTLLDIADRAGLPFDVIHEAATLLYSHGLLRELDD
jgi:aminopeptidase-like protein